MKWIRSSAVSLGVIAVILLILVPLPTWALDIFLMLNLSLAMIVLLTSMYAKNALEFSIFPSLLLLTTLFRLSLEISATKLVLSNGGFAGQVIRTFGNFVIPNGNIVVGLVVFLIIVCVNFIVITKGSERVAEVAARFTLDAMPGKQMAIDADLNSGLITEETARRRRSEIQREADFYGAMDGASKFVKGDAIIAIVIIIINIVGGMITGVLSGEDITKVAATYTLATIGEGLMAQLPALLISTATGIIVTRAASEGSMSDELVGQLFGQPMVLRTTGIVLLIMMVLPGFPKLVLLLVGGLFVFLSFTGRGGHAVKETPAALENAQKIAAADSELERLKNPENIYAYLEVETIEMEFGYSLIPLVDESQGGTFVDKVVMFRRQFAMDTGIVIPSVRMRDNIQLPNNRYLVKIRGEAVAQGEILVGNLLVMNPASDDFAIDGVDTVEPAFGLRARWIPSERRDDAEMAGYTVIEPAAVMMTHLAEVVRRHAWELLGRREVNALLDMVKRNNQTLVDEVVPTKISVGDLQKVLQNLLREEVPIRDMVTILETVADHSAKIKDTDLLTEFVRQSLKRTISHKLAPDGDLKVITIDPQVEKVVSASIRRTEQGAYLALEPDRAQSIIDNISRTVDKCGELGLEPVVLVSPAIRLYFKRLTEQVIPHLCVISYNELENNVKVQAISAIAA